MASRKELEQRVLALEQRATNTFDKLLETSKQLKCSLTRHTCGHEGHLFQFVSKSRTCEDSFNSMFSTALMSSMEETDQNSDQNSDKAGKFQCKFCSITMTRRMTADELKAADKLSLGN